jgi:hypothetical protein
VEHLDVPVEMTQKTRRDVQRVRGALSRIEMANVKAEVEAAAPAGEEDAGWTESKEREQEQDRAGAEKNAEATRAAMRSMRIKSGK